MKRPRLLDLFCGAGGAAMGYYRAGFEVIGVDIKPQPRYPFEFHQADALEFCAAHGAEYDAIHASPPCQAYSITRSIHHKTRQYPDLVAATRSAMMAAGRPYVIENVPGAPLRTTVFLCGTMFGLRTYRHRLFECSFAMLAPTHPPHLRLTAQVGRKALPDQFICVAGHCYTSDAKEALGIEWMRQRELSQAIPPAYTEYIGQQLIKFLRLNQ